MAFIIKDRVKEITTSTGTGAISLGGASSTFDQFQTYMSNGDTTYYAIASEESGVDEWEVGIGTWNTGNTLTRTTILAGSNSTSAVNFTAGDKQIFMTYPAAKAAFFNADGDLDLTRDPQTALQAATKQYVDTIAAAGIHYHDPVRVEQEGNLSATYSNGTAGVGATLTNNSTQAALSIDGVTLSLNDRVLIYEQTNSYENGIYTVTDTGSASTNWVLTRATDADSYGASDPDALGQGDAFFVLEGAAGAGELYVMNTEGAITFGTTAITFTQVAATAVYTAGDGLTLTGTEFAVGAGTGVTVGTNSVSIGQAVSTSDTPTFAGLTSTANISLGDDDKVLLGASNDLEIYHESATGDSHIVNNGTGDLKVSSNIVFADNDRTIFGNGNDLQIFHTGANSIIAHNGGGDLQIRATDFIIKNSGNTKIMASFVDGGTASLRYDNVVKIATSSTGIDVTGTVTADDTITVNGTTAEITLNASGTTNGVTLSQTSTAGILINNASQPLQIKGQGGVGASQPIEFYTGNNVKRAEIAGSTGDISFYEDTGTTAKFFWDASAERLGIGDGTNTPPRTLHLKNDVPSIRLTDSTANDYAEVVSTDGDLFIRADHGNTHAGSRLSLQVDGTDALYIDDSLNVGIGTSSPSSYHANADNLVIEDSGNAGITIATTDSAYFSQINFADGTSGAQAYTGILRYAHSDNSLRIIVNTGEKMRIDSSGFVGIKNTAPSALLEVGNADDFTLGGTSGNSLESLRLTYDTANADTLVFSTERTSTGTTWAQAAHRIQRLVDTTNMGYMQFGHHNSDLITFGEGSTEYVRIDGDGKVGIAVTSPDGKLEVQQAQNSATAGSFSGPHLRLSNSTTTDVTGFTGIAYSGSTADNYGWTSGVQRTAYNGTDVDFIWRHHSNSATGTEVMRLESGGHLLVGTTSTSLAYTTNAGAAIYADGSHVNSRDGGIAGYYNRISSDGPIVVFNRNGTTAGSIASRGGVVTSIVLDPRTGGGGLGATGPGSLCATNNTGASTTDGVLDLGHSGARWKDIYLSGSLSDGTTSRTVADIVGLTSSQFLRSDADDTTTGKLTISGSGTIGGSAISNGYLQITDGSATLAFDGNEIVGSASTYIRSVSGTTLTLGTGTDAQISINSTGIRIGDTGNGYFRPVSGSYGSIEIDGGAHNGYEGYSIGGVAVFMTNSTTVAGLYNDANNHWWMRGTFNGATEIHYQGTSKLQTTSTGVNVTGALTATTKSFVIDHPTKEGMKLRYGSLEGPEDGVYVRGRLTGETVIELPDYWTGLVHEDSITVQLTAMGGKADLWVESIADNKVTVGCDTEVDCFYFVQATRKDVDAWDVEYVADS